MSNQLFGVSVKGHLTVTDDLGHTLVDKDNAIHPQNMARVIARALANEPNYFIHRIAFGRGGTLTDAAFTTTFRPPNDGQSPDPNTWNSTLYDETYSEIIDDSNPLVSSGEGADPLLDPPSVEHTSGPGVISNELGLTSEVVVTAVLNQGEPAGQFATDNLSPSETTESEYMFDEIALFTSGAPSSDTAGYHNVDVGNKLPTDDSGLTPGVSYDFEISVDGAAAATVAITPIASGTGGEVLYQDLIDVINGYFVSTGINATAAMSYGFIRFESLTLGTGSSVVVADGTGANPLFDNLNPPTGGLLTTPVSGIAAGVQNDPANPSLERERMLTHVIFSPVLKSANRSLTITYTLTISVARTA